MTFDEACVAMRQGKKARPTWFANDGPLLFVAHRDYLPAGWLPAGHEWRESGAEFFVVGLDPFSYAHGYLSQKELGPLTLQNNECEWELFDLPVVRQDGGGR